MEKTDKAKQIGYYGNYSSSKNANAEDPNEFEKTVYGSNFSAALAHYLLFTHFTPNWEVNKILWLKSEAAVITTATVFKLAPFLNWG